MRGAPRQGRLGRAALVGDGHRHRHAHRARAGGRRGARPRPAADVTMRIGDTRWPIGPSSGGSKTLVGITPAVRAARPPRCKQKLFAAVAPKLGVQRRAAASSARGEVRDEGRPKRHAVQAGVAVHEAASSSPRTRSARPTTAASEGGLRRRAVRAGRGRHRDRRDQRRAGGRGARLRAADQPARGAEPDQRRHHPRHLVGAVRGPACSTGRRGGCSTRTSTSTRCSARRTRRASRRSCSSSTSGLTNTDAHGIGEPANIATAAAVANAVYNAIGVRIRELPMTPQVVLAALQGEGVMNASNGSAPKIARRGAASCGASGRGAQGGRRRPARSPEGAARGAARAGRRCGSSPGSTASRTTRATGLQLGALTHAGAARARRRRCARAAPGARRGVPRTSATPQVRNMATLGGNLAQRPRCWYFRSEPTSPAARGRQRRASRSRARTSTTRSSATSTCAIGAPVDAGAALVALDARADAARTSGRRATLRSRSSSWRPRQDVTRENVLAARRADHPGDAAARRARLRTAYMKQDAKESFDWPLAVAAVALEMDGQDVQARRRWCSAPRRRRRTRATAAEAALVGQADRRRRSRRRRQGGDAGRDAAGAATRTRSPIFKVVVRRALEQARR